MSRKISKETDYKYHSDRTDYEEFNYRTINLLKCFNSYFIINPDIENLRNDLKRMNVNKICKKPMDQLKEFVMSTGARYNNVYAPVDGHLEDLIRKDLKLAKK
jgi:hypothetical protein